LRRVGNNAPFTTHCRVTLEASGLSTARLKAIHGMITPFVGPEFKSQSTNQDDSA